MKPLFLHCSSFADAFDDCVMRVKNRKIDLDKKTVVIVPDKYTLYAEKRLFSGGGAFDAEVVTFSRLLSKTGFRPKNTLSRFGSVMLLKKIIAGGEELKCFKKSARFTGFAGKMYDTIAQLNASGVSLAGGVDCGDGALKVKTEDIALLQQRYAAAIKGRYFDSSELLKALPLALEKSGYLTGATVYLLNFDRFTFCQNAIIEEMGRLCDMVFVYETSEPTANFLKVKDMEIYPSPDYASALKAAARRIRTEITESGGRFSDFCVVTANPDLAAAERIFTEYGIRIAVDDKYPLSLHPTARFLLAALDAATGRLSRDKVIRLSKIAVSGIATDEAAHFENYCNRLRVDYKGFCEPFGDERAELTRQKAMSIIDSLSAALRPQMNAEDFVFAIENLLSMASPVENTCEKYDLVGFGKSLDEIIKLMKTVMGGGVYSTELLAATLKEGIDSRSLAYLPTYSDCLAVGPPSLFRGQRFKKVFVLGFDEGVLPIVSSDCGIITDGEIDRLQSVGKKVEPKIAEVNDRAERELLHLLASGESLFLSYTSGAACSPLLTRIERENQKGGRIRKTGLAYEKNVLDYGDEKEKENVFLNYACSFGGAKEVFTDAMTRHTADGELLAALSLSLGEKANELLSLKREDFVLQKKRKIFFRKKTAYISQIQTFFCCPFSHFLKYGLGLKEREDGSASPKDVGTVLHKVAELFTAASDFLDPETSAVKLFDGLAGAMPEYDAMKEGEKVRLREECKKLCRTIAKQFALSDYGRLGEELRFGFSGAPLGGETVKLPSGEVTFVGVIDRADVKDGKVRIIDYKSGGIDKKLSDYMFYYGINLQLQFYGHVMKKSGYDVAGMFYFPIGSDWTDSAEYCRMRGIFDSDLNRVLEMDRSLNEGKSSELFNARTYINKKGELVFAKPNALALPSGRIACVCEYAEKVFLSGVEDISNCLITPMPYRDGRNTACDYCPFSSVCVRDGEISYRELCHSVRGGFAFLDTDETEDVE